MHFKVYLFDSVTLTINECKLTPAAWSALPALLVLIIHKTETRVIHSHTYRCVQRNWYQPSLEQQHGQGMFTELSDILSHVSA